MAVAGAWQKRQNGDGGETVRFFRYRLPLNRPIQTATGLLTERCGLYLQLTGEMGEGWGEIAPLDGYSRETFAEVLEAARACLRGQVTLTEIAAALPALGCGLAFARVPLKPVAGVTRLRVARLLDQQSGSELLAEAHRAIALGYSVLKIKVGRRPMAEELAIIDTLQRELPAGVTLRLDANRRWPLTEALTFSRGLLADKIAFIEEPLANFADYDEYDRRRGLPFALDETLAERRVEELGCWRQLRAVVLKPSLLGGPEICRCWADWAMGQGLTVVVSSMYESGLGMRALLHFAATLDASAVCGFDTYAALAGDPVVPPLALARGEIALTQLAGWRIDRRLLTVVR